MSYEPSSNLTINIGSQAWHHQTLTSRNLIFIDGNLIAYGFFISIHEPFARTYISKFTDLIQSITLDYYDFNCFDFLYLNGWHASLTPTEARIYLTFM
jgi:hypothetical protein